VTAQALSGAQLQINTDENAHLSVPGIYITVNYNGSNPSATVQKAPELSLQSFASSLLWLIGIVSTVSVAYKRAMNIFNTIPNFGIATAQRSSLSDIAGYEKVKDELMDFVRLLKDQKIIAKMRRLGVSSIPCGALLLGPPGTGKTALIRPIAIEVNWPSFDASATTLSGQLLELG